MQTENDFAKFASWRPTSFLFTLALPRCMENNWERWKDLQNFWSVTKESQPYRLCVLYFFSQQRPKFQFSSFLRQRSYERKFYCNHTRKYWKMNHVVRSLHHVINFSFDVTKVDHVVQTSIDSWLSSWAINAVSLEKLSVKKIVVQPLKSTNVLVNPRN